MRGVHREGARQRVSGGDKPVGCRCLVICVRGLHDAIDALHRTAALAAIDHRDDAGFHQTTNGPIERGLRDIGKVPPQLLGGEVVGAQCEHYSHPDRVQ